MYINENDKAHHQINRITNKKRQSEDDKIALDYWNERLDLHEQLGVNNKALTAIERVDTELAKRSSGQRRERSPPSITKNVEKTTEQSDYEEDLTVNKRMRSSSVASTHSVNSGAMRQREPVPALDPEVSDMIEKLQGITTVKPPPLD